jgi:hypothetical protein
MRAVRNETIVRFYEKIINEKRSAVKQKWPIKD